MSVFRHSTSRWREHIVNEQSRFKYYRENRVLQWQLRGLPSIQI
ncbi:UNVERIFIED_ORG: hypothetical protein J2Y84_003514 [Pseudomonas reinekei]|nr:hypothetical protein [Pseudomonas reinekei]MDF9907874.1 hypothetical protein [Pseudomonas reinekei]